MEYSAEVDLQEGGAVFQRSKGQFSSNIMCERKRAKRAPTLINHRVYGR